MLSVPVSSEKTLKKLVSKCLPNNVSEELADSWCLMATLSCGFFCQKRKSEGTFISTQQHLVFLDKCKS